MTFDKIKSNQNNHLVKRVKCSSDGFVNISIFNVAGQFIVNLVNDYQLHGEKNVSWNTKDETGNDVPSGIYYYVVSNGKYKEARTLTLLK